MRAVAAQSSPQPQTPDQPSPSLPTQATAQTQLPPRAVAAAVHVVCGGRLRILGVSEVHTTYARVAASTSELLCDGCRPATLLGALPGLSPSSLATYKDDLDSASARAGFRLVTKSYEIDAIAASPHEARQWVRGVNSLPLGGKHRALLHLVRQQAGAGVR